MATRRTCREWVVQILFQVDLNASENLEPLFKLFWKRRKSDRKAREFTESRVRGVLTHQTEIDSYIETLGANWSLKRMGVIDRNVLRMAIYELQHAEDVPPIVIINEAVDVAKYFSNSESGRFVNGVLDRARQDLKRPLRRPAPQA